MRARLGVVPQQDLKITNLGIDKLVDGWVVSDVVGVRKPDPRIFTIAAEQAEVAPCHFEFVARFEFMGARRDLEIAAVGGAFAVQLVGHEDIAGLRGHVDPGHVRVVLRQGPGTARQKQAEQSEGKWLLDDERNVLVEAKAEHCR